MKKIMATIGMVVLVAGSSFAQGKTANESERKQERSEMHEKRQHDMWADIPDLTDEQRTQIKTIREESRKNSEPQRQQMKELRSKLQELKRAENPDQTQIDQLIDKSAAIKAEMQKAKVASELKVRSILTPEQRKVVDAKHEEHMKMSEKERMEKKEMRKHH